MEYFMDKWKRFEMTGDIMNYLDYKSSLYQKAAGEADGNDKGDGNSL